MVYGYKEKFITQKSNGNYFQTNPTSKKASFSYDSYLLCDVSNKLLKIDIWLVSLDLYILKNLPESLVNLKQTFTSSYSVCVFYVEYGKGSNDSQKILYMCNSGMYFVFFKGYIVHYVLFWVFFQEQFSSMLKLSRFHSHLVRSSLRRPDHIVPNS